MVIYKIYIKRAIKRWKLEGIWGQKIAEYDRFCGRPSTDRCGVYVKGSWTTRDWVHRFRRYLNFSLELKYSYAEKATTFTCDVWVQQESLCMLRANPWYMRATQVVRRRLLDLHVISNSGTAGTTEWNAEASKLTIFMRTRPLVMSSCSPLV